jgi:hypothetical protein
MKIHPLILSGILALSTWFAQCSESFSPGDQRSQLEERVRSLVTEVNIDSAALVELGLERCIADRKQGLNCILTLTDEIEISKYTDGVFTLIVLPREGTSRTGIERFVWGYNSQVIRETDDKLKRGELDFAEKTYRLLLKHCPLTRYDRELRARLELIAKARSGGGKIDVKALEQLEPNEPAGVFWAEMSTKPAEKVENLLQVQVKDPVTSLTESERERKPPVETKRGEGN